SMATVQSVPIWRLTERMVRSTLVTACRLATSPTSTSPDFAKATTDGVVRAPSAFAMTVGSPPSRTATTEFVVPRSIPTARAMVLPPVAPAGPAMLLGLGFWSGVRVHVCGPARRCRNRPESVKQLESVQLNSCQHNARRWLRVPGHLVVKILHPKSVDAPPRRPRSTHRPQNL